MISSQGNVDLEKSILSKSNNAQSRLDEIGSSAMSRSKSDMKQPQQKKEKQKKGSQKSIGETTALDIIGIKTLTMGSMNSHTPQPQMHMEYSKNNSGGPNNNHQHPENIIGSMQISGEQMAPLTPVSNKKLKQQTQQLMPPHLLPPKEQILQMVQEDLN